MDGLHPVRVLSVAVLLTLDRDFSYPVYVWGFYMYFCGVHVGGDGYVWTCPFFMFCSFGVTMCFMCVLLRCFLSMICCDFCMCYVVLRDLLYGPSISVVCLCFYVH